MGTGNKIKEKVHNTDNQIKNFNNKTETDVKKALKNKIQSKIVEKVNEFSRIPAEIREEETLNNRIKHFASNSLQNASGRLKKELSAELQKESAEDTLEKVMALFKFKIEKFAEDFQKAAEELKAEISDDILSGLDKKEILEKARAVKILLNAGKSSIEDKE